MVSSADLVGDRDALRERLDTDGYLYLPGLLPREKVLSLRRKILTALRDIGWVDPEAVLMRGAVLADPVREGEESFLEASDAVQKLEDFHALAHDETLVGVMREVLGDTAFPHPLKITRMIFPMFEAVSTPPHQDYPNNQGTESLTASWVPLGDIPSEMGGLAVLEGSHRWGKLPLTGHLGAGNRCAVLPPDMLEDCRWRTTEYQAGDVVLFPSLTVHAARHNLSPGYFRLSVDFRYQLEGEPLTSGCLEPHFGRPTWEEIYSGWRSDEHKYYWKDLDFEVVEFESLELETSLTKNEMIAEYLAQERRIGRRRGTAEVDI